ncbi:MAG: ATP synthase F1 subunit delta [Peptococcaceae bacterium]|nr:ATP synthase F1 subunit delta [Peptococcaceae bacterium]
MLTERVAKRYARALFTAAREKGRVTEVAGDLENISAAAEDNEELRRFLYHPRISPAVKKEILEELFGARIQELALNLLVLLVSKGRFGILPVLSRIYQSLVDREQGIARAAVASAVPLDDDHRKRLTAVLRRLAGRNEIRTDWRVEPDVIGGFVAYIGDRVIDASVRGMLSRV